MGDPVRVAITGGTGFVGRHLARMLADEGHEVVVVARGLDRRDQAIRHSPGISFVAAGVDDEPALRQAFEGAAAVVQCAGINREIGQQTYRWVHVDGTRAVAAAAGAAGAERLVLLSFLRARPGSGSPYHASKWLAEEIVRRSGLPYTIAKAGVIYGRGDHMLDHLSHALHTFPVFGLVGFRDRPMRPVAVADVVGVLAAAALGDDRLRNRTVSVVGPEELGLAQAVRRVAEVVDRRPLFVPLPIPVIELVAALAEMLMTVPLVSRAQARILAEGIVDPLPFAGPLPPDLAPATPFSEASIRAGLPPPGGFGRRDLRWQRA